MKNKIKYSYTLILLGILSLPSVINARTVSYVKCGAKKTQGLSKFPKKFPELTSFVVSILEVAVPVLLVLMGVFDLVRAISAGKEDEIKKAQSTFIKRLITGALVFFIIAIVKLLINILDSKGAAGIIDCVNCFVSNSCTAIK